LKSGQGKSVELEVAVVVEVVAVVALDRLEVLVEVVVAWPSPFTVDVVLVVVDWSPVFAVEVEVEVVTLIDGAPGPATNLALSICGALVLILAMPDFK
jgi:hypothetical protein